MTQEQLRMQMLAGIITESQYKEKMEEIDSYGRVGKSYPAPGQEDALKGKKLKKAKRALERKGWELKFEKMITDLYNDASKGLIFVSETPEEHKEGGNKSVFVDENSKYKNLLTGKRNEGLGDEGVDTYAEVLPKSEAIAPPYKLDIRNFPNIIYAVLRSGIDGNNYHVKRRSDAITDKGDMIEIGWAGYVVDMSKFKRDDPDFGFPKEIGNGMAWVPFTFRD